MPKRMSAYEALALDTRTECRRHGFAEPQISVGLHGSSGSIEVAGPAKLVFEFALSGPMLLGRGQHLGLDLFQWKA
jgi:hypothetical protein